MFASRLAITISRITAPLSSWRVPSALRSLTVNIATRNISIPLKYSLIGVLSRREILDELRTARGPVGDRPLYLRELAQAAVDFCTIGVCTNDMDVRARVHR